MLRWRDRILADRRFQRMAARFWATRYIARSQAAALFDLCAGFVYSQCLAACVQLGLFDLLADGPRDEAAIAEATDLPVDGARTLLEASVGAGLLVRRRGGRFGLSMLGAASRGNPGIAAMIAHHALFYDDLRDPVALLRRPRGGTSLGGYWSYAGAAAPALLGGAAVGRYSALMAASLPMIADEVLAAYDFGRHAALLDVGGGDGSFLETVGRRAPRLGLMLFDLPPVASLARERLAAAGFAARSDCRGGSFLADPLPRGADIISFVRVLHDHDDDTVRTLLAAARAALPAGGTVLVAEPMADDPRAAAYFHLYLRAMGSGRPRSSAELAALLVAAGFEAPRAMRTPTPMIARVLVAQCKSRLTDGSVSLG